MFAIKTFIFAIVFVASTNTETNLTPNSTNKDTLAGMYLIDPKFKYKSSTTNYSFDYFNLFTNIKIFYFRLYFVP